VNKHFRFLIVGLVGVWVVAACGGGGASGPAPLDVKFTMDNTFKFDPSTLTAQVGQAVNVTMNNTGALEHTFLIDELGVNSGSVPAGQNATFSFTPSQAGTYTFYCNVPGHKEGGMTGTLTVTE
jgi:plastocyanin